MNIAVACSLILLFIGTTLASSVQLAKYEHPETTIPNLIISLCSIFLTIYLWRSKRELATSIGSTIIASDAACNLACVSLSFVMLVGSIIFIFWIDGWWIDSSVALILAIFFLKEGISMIKYSFSKDFKGGCCNDCNKNTNNDNL